MIDAAGDVIYVGKARSLKARVANYTRVGGHTNRIARMIAATRSMEFVTTRTETEALLLEANLIKRFRPRFNVLLRDDKSFPYILISRDHGAPQILKHRGARKRRATTSGRSPRPARSTDHQHAAARLPAAIVCRCSVFESRTRPCLLYQIKRCSAPCVGEIDTGTTPSLVADAMRLLGRQVRRRAEAAGRPDGRPPTRWSSSAPPSCATACAR